MTRLHRRLRIHPSVRRAAACHAQTEPTPEKVRILLQTLSEIEVLQWIDHQRVAPAAPRPAAAGQRIRRPGCAAESPENLELRPGV